MLEDKWHTEDAGLDHNMVIGYRDSKDKLERDPEEKSGKLYTIYATFDDEGCEEIDLLAKDPASARKLARRILNAHYEPGGKIEEVIYRPYGMLFF
jgi:hypothetical protein